MALSYPLILDGGFATELERQFGKDLSGQLWSAKCLDEDPEAIKAIHLAYYEAGAHVATTSSYQATVEGFLEAGYSHSQAITLMQKSVSLAREARDTFKSRHPDDTEPRLIALSIGCYGAKLANGAEYTGDYGSITKDELIQFHRDRLLIFLKEPGIDLIVFETVPSSLEAEAIKDLVNNWDLAVHLPPVAVSFSCQSDNQIADGTPLSQCVEYYDNVPSVVAIGVNCTQLRYISGLVAILAEKKQQTGKAVIIYPNKGDVWDAENRSWIIDSNSSVESFCQLVKKAVKDCGKEVMVGGCCGTQVSHISYLKEHLFK